MDESNDQTLTTNVLFLLWISVKYFFLYLMVLALIVFLSLFGGILPWQNNIIRLGIAKQNDCKSANSFIRTFYQ